MVLGNGLWALASLVWLGGSIALLASNLLSSSPPKGSCTLALGKLAFFDSRLPCPILQPLLLVCGYSLVAPLFIAGWYISLERNVRANGGLGSSFCWDGCCRWGWCEGEECRGVWGIDNKVWVLLFRMGLLCLQALATLALPFNVNR